MSNSPAIIAARMASIFHFQGSAVFSLPRLSKGNDGIRCFGRSYGSSDGPVRYIPKKGVKKVEGDRESSSGEVEVPGSAESLVVSDGKSMEFKVLREGVGDGSWVRKGEVLGWSGSRKISDHKAMTSKVLHKDDVQKGEVPGSIESRVTSDVKAMSVKVSHKEVAHRSWVQEGEVPGSTASLKTSRGKALTFKVKRKEAGKISGVWKGELHHVNSSRVPKNNVLANSFESPGIIKNKCKHDLAFDDIGQILDEMDDEYVEYPEQDSEEIVLQSSKVSNNQVLTSGKGRSDAEEKAIQLLATRAYTAVELRKKLCSKHFPPGIVESLINDFQERGLINDSLYAEAFSRSRWSSSYWGPGRIKRELYRKGVNQMDAENAVKLVFQDSNSDGEQESPGQALSRMSLEHLYAQASKQWGRSRGLPIETRKSRLVRWLQYRGFNWSVIGSILRKLESQPSVERERRGV